MTLEEMINECDIKTAVFFRTIKSLLRRGEPYGWLPMDARGLAKHLSVSQSFCYAKLESLRAQGILAKGKKGYYCPALVRDWIAKWSK